MPFQRLTQAFSYGRTIIHDEDGLGQLKTVTAITALLVGKRSCQYGQDGTRKQRAAKPFLSSFSS